MKRKIKVSNKLGLHARASSKLVNITNQFESEIKISKENLEIDAKSILGILSLAASKGTEIEINITGNDEEYAMKKITELFDSKFGEDS
ncbi:HPr family phosphocarrier protein [bacterium]|nr:HPr family phosphocarrier protein [bacterium]|tara:strand:- start:279 stop:545 length:267 start_codon:yes stop_codon:yes gene_type:complete